MRRLAPALVSLLLLLVQSCDSSEPPPAAGSGHAAFRQLASEILEFTYELDPSNATYLGIHKYDDLIADRSSDAVKAEVQAIKSFRRRLNSVDAETLSPDAQLDLEQTK